MATETTHRNERLRTAIAKSGQTIDSVAQHLAVDRKTVERWIGGRTPHARYRWGVGALLGEDHTYLWPEDDHRNRSSSAADQEIITFYPSRATVPADLWKRFFARAAEHIDVLVYAAVFLHEQDPDLNDLLHDRASQGCRIRIAIGDPTSDAVRLRGEEENFGHGIQSRCELALLHYRPLLNVPGVSVHVHDTTLYNSIYRVDDEMIINTHVWGANAYLAPTYHLRRVDGGTLFDTYARSFDAVWATSKPVQLSEAEMKS